MAASTSGYLRKLRPRKVTTTNENSQKVNVISKTYKNKSHGTSSKVKQVGKFKRSRPRQKKNYDQDLKLLHLLPPLQRNSTVMIEKLSLTDDKKVPVYKTIKTSEISTENKNDIYDFKYDSNDTKEKVVKKKKRKRNINTAGKKVIARKKGTMKSKAVDNETNKPIDLDTNLPEKIAQNKESLPRIIPEIVEEATSSDQVLTEQIRKQDTKKPRIISIENADNIIVTKTPPSGSLQKDFQPFRPTNIFNNKPTVQHKNTLSCSLLTKSLSPIVKTYDTFDLGSPWRPPTFQMFSSAKHFVQSTPNMNKMDTCHKNPVRHLKNDSHNDDKTVNMSDIKNMSSITEIKTKPVSIHKASVEPQSGPFRNVENLQNYNKIDTVHKNLVTHLKDNFHNDKTVNVSDTKNMNSIAKIETTPVLNDQMNTIMFESASYPLFDDTEDKENAAPNYQTPKKLVKKKLKSKKRYLSNSLSKAYENKSNVQRQNVPQSGPSRNMEDEENYNKQNILCHLNKQALEIENAFGFCEMASELDVPTTEDKLVTNQVNKVKMKHAIKPVTQPMPARLSLGELKNQLIQEKPDTNVDKEQKTDQKKIEISKSVEEKNKILVDTISFSDTFDVLPESERQSNCHNYNIPLFMDSEPSYFSKPPQHSYKRKRVVTFNYSEDSEKEAEENERENVKMYTKKKKLTKLEKEKKKKVEEWVKKTNTTFQEIDDYDLLIE